MSSDSDIPDREDMERIFQEFPERKPELLLLGEILEALRLIEGAIVSLHDSVDAMNVRRT